MARVGSAVIALMLVAAGILASSGEAFAQRGCIRIGFSGQNGVLTNMCGRYLYVIWSDERGEHTTAIGPNTSLNVGRVVGRIQIDDARPQ